MSCWHVSDVVTVPMLGVHSFDLKMSMEFVTVRLFGYGGLIGIVGDSDGGANGERD